jgi:hypothetical protein
MGSLLIIIKVEAKAKINLNKHLKQGWTKKPLNSHRMTAICQITEACKTWAPPEAKSVNQIFKRKLILKKMEKYKLNCLELELSNLF